MRIRTLALLACGGAAQRGAAAQQPAETPVAATRQPAAAIAAAPKQPSPPVITPAPGPRAAPPRAPAPVPTPGETANEYRQRLMDAEMAFSAGVSVDARMATRSAISTATRAAMGGLQPLPHFPPGTHVSGGSSASFVDERHGWILAGSSERRLLATTHGGARWTLVRMLDFAAGDIDFVSPPRAGPPAGWGSTPPTTAGAPGARCGRRHPPRA